MDGIHDLGGKQGFGRVNYPDMPHEETWHPLARALGACVVGKHVMIIDEVRHAIERMPARNYLSAAYYERHLVSIGTLLVEKGITTPEELDELAGGTFPLSAPMGPGRLPGPPQSFANGETVRVKNEHFAGHVRFPGYVRGKTGKVVGITPAYPFPDAVAHGMGAPMEPTCDVRFRARDLWPESCDDAIVNVGIFQSYLEKV